MTETKIIKNTSVLSIAGILSKIISALYKFPLIKILGQDGFGIYTLTYPILAFFLILSSSAFPIGISKYISSKKINNENYLSDCFVFCIVFGFIFSVIIIILANIISGIQGNLKYQEIYFLMSSIILLSFL